MRAAWGLVLVLLLVLGPPAAGADAHDGGDDDADASPAEKLSQRARSGGLHKIPPALGVGGMAMGGLALLACGLVAAHRARGVRARVPPKKSFERGRLQGRAVGVASPEEALRALGRHPIGRVVEAAPEADGRICIRVERGKRESCEQVAGFLVGLLESAYAGDVRLIHTECGGRKKHALCTYEAVPVVPLRDGTGFNTDGPRGAGSSTPG